MINFLLSLEKEEEGCCLPVVVSLFLLTLFALLTLKTTITTCSSESHLCQYDATTSLAFAPFIVFSGFIVDSGEEDVVDDDT